MNQHALRTISPLGFLLMLTVAFAYAQFGPVRSASGKAAAGNFQCGAPNATLLATGLQGATGSTIGPGGALYVTEGAAGRISRVDPQTGEITMFASGLPKPADPSSPFGGAGDLAFLGKAADALVTLVGSDVGGS